MTLPEELAASRWAQRLEVAIAAVRSAGAALMELRGSIHGTETGGGQLKTSIDLAAEGWIVGFLEGSFAGERILAEEQFDRAGRPWPGAQTYWAVDALDGTRSYVEGFDGFCSQVAFIDGGQPRLGAICAPVTGVVYAAAEGAGAWSLGRENVRLTGTRATRMGPGLRFVDSTRSNARMFEGLTFVECGSVGLKICRLAEDAADIYVKSFQPKLWDVAPGEVLLRETGARLGDYSGRPFDYAGTRTHYDGVIAASSALYPSLVAATGS